MLDTISTENNIIIGDLNVTLLIEADKEPLWNLLVRCYNQLISTYTTENRTLIDHVVTNISHLNIQAGVLKTYCTDHKAVWASFLSAIN